MKIYKQIYLRKIALILIGTLIILYYVSNLIGPTYKIFLVSAIILFIIPFIFLNKKLIISRYNFLFFLFLIYTTIQYMSSIFFYGEIVINHTFVAFLGSGIILFLFLIIPIPRLIIYYGLSMGSILNATILLYNSASFSTFSRYAGGKVEFNATGIIQVIGLWGLLRLYEGKRDFIIKILFYLGVPLITMSIFITGSRSAFATLVIFVSLEIIGKLNKFKLSKCLKKITVKYLINLIVFLLIFTIIFFLFYETVTLYFRYTISRIFKPSIFDKQSSYSRILQIKQGLRLLYKFPYLLFFGTGTGMTDNKYWTSVINEISIARIHNTYFALFIENGICGIIMLVLFIFPPQICKSIEYKQAFRKVFSILAGIAFSSFFIYTLYLIPVWVILFYPVIEYMNKKIKY